MYEKFTDRAHKAMNLACQEAQRFHHEYVGTEHILLGLISEETGVAVNILKNLDIDLRKVRREVEKIMIAGPNMVTMGKIPLTPRAQKVIEYAIEESQALNHNYVGSEHLLLGLVREDEGLAGYILINLGLRLDILRQEILNLLGPAHADVADVVPSTTMPRYHEEENPAPPEAPSDAIKHLPDGAREIVAEFNRQVDVIQEQKKEAVAIHAFDKAAELRDLEYKLRKLRDEFISQWPK